MKTGIQISSLKPLLTSPQEVRASFEKVRKTGCEYVQLQWIDPVVPVEEIAKAVCDTGLCSVSVQDFYETVCVNPAYYIRLNQLTGGEWCCISRIPERFRSREGLSACVREFRALSDQLKEYHQRLCFHPVTHDYEKVDGMDPVESLLEQMPELSLCLDLYHLNRAGRSMPEWIAQHAGRICMVHFKDAKDGQLVPAGQGDTNWKGVVHACRNAGVEYAFVEQETWSRDPFVCLEEALQWLREQEKQ